jgi:hypothetical protein
VSTSSFNPPTIHVYSLADAAKFAAKGFEQDAASTADIKNLYTWTHLQVRRTKTIRHLLAHFAAICIIKIRDEVLVVKCFGGSLILKSLREYAMSPTPSTFQDQELPPGESLSADNFRGSFRAPTWEIVNLPKLIPSLHISTQRTPDRTFRQHELKVTDSKCRVKMRRCALYFG